MRSRRATKVALLFFIAKYLHFRISCDMIKGFIFLIHFMTTQKTVSKKAIHKKLLFIGVVVSLLAALIVWNPGGTI